MISAYFIDFVLLAFLIIGITATFGIITNSFGEKVIGRKRRTENYDQSIKIQKGWKNVGGK